MKRHGLLILFMNALAALHTRFQAMSSICCLPDQLEAVLIYDLGQCFIDTDTAYSYTNSVVRLAYDYKNKRVYLNITALEISPLIPTPLTEVTTMIYDYAKGMQYTFNGESCTKEETTEPMTQECIPDNAVLTSSFYMGSADLEAKVYSFTSRKGLKAKVRASIDPKTCIPFAQEWILGSGESDSGTLNEVQVMNVTRGIKDLSIFTPPKSCFNASDFRLFKALFHEGHSKKRRVKKLPHLLAPLF